jgi:UDP-N-acetylglucosamine 2-epimerase (non-hydrolysing)
MKVMMIFGTRPEAVKMVLVVLALWARSASFDVTVCVTAQYNEMLRQVTDLFEIEPQDYIPFIYLIERSYLILTDSDVVQEEASSIVKSVLVMRETTERPEAIDAGTVQLVGIKGATIQNAVTVPLDDKEHYRKISVAHKLFGDGKAGVAITSFIAVGVSNQQPNSNTENWKQ